MLCFYMVMSAWFGVLNDLVLLEFYCVYVPCFGGVFVIARAGWSWACAGVMQNEHVGPLCSETNYARTNERNRKKGEYAPRVKHV